MFQKYNILFSESTRFERYLGPFTESKYSLRKIVEVAEKDFYIKVSDSFFGSFVVGKHLLRNSALEIRKVLDENFIWELIFSIEEHITIGTMRHLNGNHLLYLSFALQNHFPPEDHSKCACD